LSVILPMWRLSRREPMNALIAEDNSNLVISPRQSFDLSKTCFPSGYEAGSVWRFRKYHFRQIFTSVIFIALFMSVLYYADVCRRQLEYDLPQFSVSFESTDYSYTDIDREYLEDISGVTAVSKDVHVNARDIHSHVVLKQSNVRLNANASFAEDGSGDRVVNGVSYHACDDEIVDFLSRYRYDGELEKVLEDNANYVIVTDGYDNISRYRFRPGDKIRTAKAVRQKRYIGDNLTGGDLLDKELQSYEFEYTEYTVCAVIKDLPCFGSTPFYIRTDSYEALTGSQAIYKSVDIYVDKESDIDTVNGIREELRGWTAFYEGAYMTDRHASSEYRIENAKCKPVIYTVCACLALVFAPLMQIFTQILYYEKREGEFDILQAFGAVSREIRSIFAGEGVFGAVFGIILSQAINLGAVYAVFYFCNVIIPKFGGVDIRYPFALPVFAILLGIAVAAASALISSYLPYRSYMKRKHKEEENDIPDPLPEEERSEI
ncbi:MAG: ABC transporter permease, partial [Clostridiales bacterium]|nr:ABC transporter permease [Clostridiales bacterium]